MSLVQSAKLNRHDPYAYLKDVLIDCQAIRHGRSMIAWRITGWEYYLPKKAPAQELSEDALLAWCHINLEEAPACLAYAILPLLSDEGEGRGKRFSSLIGRIIDEFGEREDVQQALVVNMHTFAWSGSLATYYGLYEQPLAALYTHAKASVRRRSKKMSDSMSKQIAQCE